MIYQIVYHWVPFVYQVRVSVNPEFLYHLILTALYEVGLINIILQMKKSSSERLKNLPKFTYHVSPCSSCTS